MVNSVLLAGGKGSRLGLNDRPKPMAVVGERPVIAQGVHELYLSRFSAEDITVVTGHLGRVIVDYFRGDVHYAHQADQNGNASALLAGFKNLANRGRAEASDALLVIQADDCAFIPAAIYQALLIQHDCQNADLTLLLNKQADPNVHNLRYIVDGHNGEIHKVEPRNGTFDSGGYFIGSFVLRAEYMNQLAADLLEIGPDGSESRLSDVFQNAITNPSVRTSSLLVEGQWLAINDAAGLQKARALQETLQPLEVVNGY